MALERDGNGGMIRAELVARVDAMDQYAGRLRPDELADELETIRRIALVNGLGPAVTVVHALDTALARGERGPLVHGWLAILRDALDCEATDARACDTFAAACSVRLAR